MEESLPTSKLDAPQEVTVELSLLSLDKPPKLQDRESDARQEQEDRKGELKREELASFVCRRPEKRKTLHTLEAGFGVGTVPKKLVSEDATQTKLKSSKFAWKNSRFSAEHCHQ
ncbi:uncharacterized protein LOC143233228 [Tachypleus tridentatus]|uniref:uncharacterized protein LOC143233228 n=1 Tax=Tachypleus tridentatus TaxID=6853 RepID=UPI003FCEF03D